MAARLLHLYLRARPEEAKSSGPNGPLRTAPERTKGLGPNGPFPALILEACVAGSQDALNQSSESSRDVISIVAALLRNVVPDQMEPIVNPSIISQGEAN